MPLIYDSSNDTLPKLRYKESLVSLDKNAKPLAIHNLSKHYGTFEAVKNVSFDINPGEIFGLLGPNGAGKTSIISCIVTLSNPTKGSVQVFGHEMSGNTLPTRAGKSLMGLVPQEIVNHGYFNVEEVLQFYSGYYGLLRNTSQINFLLDRLQLAEHRHKKVKQLSGGMKRRLLIAKSLLHKPKLLLLDEPTAGVDIQLRESLWGFARELKKEGVSILLTTHYLEEAESLCDRVGILNHGSLNLVGETKKLIKSLTHRVIYLKLTSMDREINHSQLLDKKEDHWLFRIPSEQTLGKLLTEIHVQPNEITDLRIEEGSLEDAFKLVLGRTE